MLLSHCRLLRPIPSRLASVRLCNDRKLHVAASSKAKSNALDRILDRAWLLDKPTVQLTEVTLPSPAAGGPSIGFHVVRDDLLHPTAGSKLRKFDAVFPDLQAQGVTDVVTCGGTQSVHIASVAALAAENGMRAHLLVRGERPEVPTGYHLIARTFGEVTYIRRSEYADRHAMFQVHEARISEGLAEHSKLAVIPEGAADATSLLGLVRLAQFLGASSLLQDHPINIVVSSGTGTTAIGLALGVALLKLPWIVTGIMLAGSRSYYESQARLLAQEFAEQHPEVACQPEGLPLTWVERQVPRRFGNVKPGEVAACRQIARSHGILLDPIYELAAWEIATTAAAAAAPGERVAMLHAGGGLGLHGLAQRFPDEF